MLLTLTCKDCNFEGYPSEWFIKPPKNGMYYICPRCQSYSYERNDHEEFIQAYHLLCKQLRSNPQITSVGLRETADFQEFVIYAKTKQHYITIKEYLGYPIKVSVIGQSFLAGDTCNK